MMKNNVNKKGSNMKKLIPAAGMLAVSATMLATSTYAWFSMNTAVTATGMNVTAQAESGIVISNSTKSAWNASAATTTGSLNLLPTSTSNGATWYHNSSDDADIATGAEHVGTYTTVTNEGSDKYYSENKFYIKSATTSSLTKDLYIKQVTITPPNAATSADLDKSLRVLVKIGDSTNIYAPTSASTLTYTVNGATSVTALDASSVNDTKVTGITSIPASTGTPIEATVYVYFEGEDANCKSNNVKATLDTMSVSVQFEAKDPVAVSP